MRTGAAAGHKGHFHETAFYGSDEEFLAIVVPFFQEGLAAGEPVVSAFGEANQDLIRSAVGARSGIEFLPGDVQYLRPASAIQQYKKMFADFVARGATQIRVAGDVPHPGTGVPWEWWARYEAVVNDAYDDFPLWGMCPYDTRTAPDDVLEQVRRTHPRIATTSGHFRNSQFQEPRHFLREHDRDDAWSDPIETTPVAIDLTNPSPRQVRLAVTALCDGLRLSDEDVNGLLLSVSEAVTNAETHGRAPVRVRMWAGPRRAVVTVTDQGAGLTNPFAGLLPNPGAPHGGLGLWLAHQLCNYVSWHADRDGFTIRLVAGKVMP